MEKTIKLNQLLLTLAIAVYGVLVPILEVNATHVFNPDWPSHARLHEVWQLTTNCMIALCCAWITWRHNNVRLAARLASVVPASFLFAYFASGTYGGSMQHTDGSELKLFALNASMLVMGVSFAVLIWQSFWGPRIKKFEVPFNA